MKKWNGYLYLNGDCQSISAKVAFDVPEKLYARMQSAIRKGKALCECDFYDELIKRLDKAFELTDYVDFDWEEPDRDEFDSREEYLEAKEEYEQELENLQNDWYLISEDIEDPGDLKRLKEQFVGKEYPKLKERTLFACCWNTWGEKSVRYTVDVTLDDKGTLTDIERVDAEGIESDDVKCMNMSEAYPNYGYLAATLEKALRTGKEP